MTLRVAAIGMSHWHSLYDSAYLRHLAAMPEVQIIGIQDDSQEIAVHRAREIGGGIPTFTDYRGMLSALSPDFVLALGRHDTMAEIANGGCLRNLGSHALDCFVYLTGEGEDIEVTGAQLSWRTRGEPVEDYASVLLKSKQGVLGTVEVGNGFPRIGTDGQLKVAFRDAILLAKNDSVVLETAEGEQVLPPPEQAPLGVLHQIVEGAKSGSKPPVSVHDCYLAVRLIDLAYLAAGDPYGTAAV